MVHRIKVNVAVYLLAFPERVYSIRPLKSEH